MSDIDNTDVCIVGGGLVGGAVAYGLSARGLRCVLLDEGDVALRASRGNFGLIWVQGKGQGMPAYSLWSRRSADLWVDFASELSAEGGIDVGHSRGGGAVIATDEEEFDTIKATMADIASAAGNHGFDYEVLDHAGLAKRVPGLGPSIPGGTYSPYDGHVNPLKMLRALHTGYLRQNGRYLSDAKAKKITTLGDGFRIETEKGTLEAGKLVLAAGLATPALAAQVGIQVPVEPDHGQVLVTERAAPSLPIATNLIRQTDEGSFQIGASANRFGYTTGTRPELMRDIAAKAVKILPDLARLRVIRTWGALRIMTPDGHPVYQQSRRHPGAFAFTCHSGVTLGAVHARLLPDWVIDGAIPAEAAVFSADRFA